MNCRQSCPNVTVQLWKQQRGLGFLAWDGREKFQLCSGVKLSLGRWKILHSPYCCHQWESKRVRNQFSFYYPGWFWSLCLLWLKSSLSSQCIIQQSQSIPLQRHLLLMSKLWTASYIKKPSSPQPCETECWTSTPTHKYTDQCIKQGYYWAVQAIRVTAALGDRTPYTCQSSVNFGQVATVKQALLHITVVLL